MAAGLFLPAVAFASGDPMHQAEPLLARYCYSCHGNDDEARKADLNLEFYAQDQLLASSGDLLEDILFYVEDGEMPPAKAEQPSDEEREQLISALDDAIDRLRNASPNDPGKVVMPRLNHREYDYVIRDLTGRDLPVAGKFPRDSGGGEGFTNVGENLVITSTHAELYLQAAKEVLRHALVLPGRDLFWNATPYPPTDSSAEAIAALGGEWAWWHTTQSDRHLKDIEQAFKDKKDQSLLGAYLRAAWDYQRQGKSGPEAFREVAESQPTPLSPAVLENWTELLTQASPGETLTPLLAEMVRRWQALPRTASEAEIGERIAEIENWRKKALNDYNGGWEPKHEIEPLVKVSVKMPRGEFVRLTERNKKWEEDLYERHTYLHRIDLTKLKDPGRLYLVTTDAGDGNLGDYVVWRDAVLVDADGDETPLRNVAARAEGGLLKPDGTIEVRAPSVVELNLPSGFERFEIAAAVDTSKGDGWSSVQTIVEDKAPEEAKFVPKRRIYGQIDPPVPQQHDDLEDVTDGAVDDALRPANDFPVELFGSAAGAFKDKRHRLEKPHFLAAESLRRYADPESAERLNDIKRQVGMLISETLAADPDHELAVHRELAAPVPSENDLGAQARDVIDEVAEKAWRRPVGDDELNALTGLYAAARAEGKSYDASVKRALSAVLVSPRFLYRVQQADETAEVEPLDDHELADRLAFAFWASIPDQKLLDLAEEGRLSDPEVLKQQARRMIRDDRASALGTEFASQWLGVSGFQDVVAPDMEAFPDYNRVLGDFMAEETELFFTDLFREDRSILNITQADYTFLNKHLAKYYGVEGVDSRQFKKVKVDAERRGGVLGMGSVLTFTSQPMRTSPVKRATWLLTEILGTPPPEPPPGIPPLPDEPLSPDGLTVKEQLAQHRADPNCAGCHAKIDPIGFAMENFDPTGRWRDKDVKGAEIDASAETVDGFELTGFAGLREYLNQDRQRDLFVRQFCRKFLGYVLGRKVTLSDDPVLDQMQEALRENDYRPSAMIDVVVTCPQFLNRRNLPVDEGGDTLAKAENGETL